MRVEPAGRQHDRQAAGGDARRHRSADQAGVAALGDDRHAERAAGARGHAPTSSVVRGAHDGAAVPAPPTRPVGHVLLHERRLGEDVLRAHDVARAQPPASSRGLRMSVTGLSLLNSGGWTIGGRNASTHHRRRVHPWARPRGRAPRPTPPRPCPRPGPSPSPRRTASCRPGRRRTSSSSASAPAPSSPPRRAPPPASPLPIVAKTGTANAAAGGFRLSNTVTGESVRCSNPTIDTRARVVDCVLADGTNADLFIIPSISSRSRVTGSSTTTTIFRGVRLRINGPEMADMLNEALEHLRLQPLRHDRHRRPDRHPRPLIHRRPARERLSTGRGIRG